MKLVFVLFFLISVCKCFRIRNYIGVIGVGKSSLPSILFSQVYKLNSFQ